MTDTTDTLTPEEQAYVQLRDAFGVDLAEYAYGDVVTQDGEHLDARARKARQPKDVAVAMRGERKLPDMLIPRWLVRGHLHWVYSDAEAGKTWLALMLALHLVRARGRVLWSDEELGVAAVADRLLALGATPEEIEGGFILLTFSDWTMDDTDVRSWNALLRAAKPDLVVFDTATDHLTSAGLDEDKGGPVTQWVHEYPQACTAMGITTLVLDHTDKRSGDAPGKHAVGSRAKRAKAKVGYALRVPTKRDKYDRTKTGKVVVELTKNTLGAYLLGGQTEVTYKVGGDGQGNFTWVQDDTFPAGVSHDDGEGIDRKRRILELLKEEGKPLTKTQITDRVMGRKQAVLKDLPEMADGETWPVRASSSGRSTIYEYFDPDPEKPKHGRTTTPKRKPAAKPRPRRATARKSRTKPVKAKQRTSLSPSKGTAKR